MRAAQSELNLTVVSTSISGITAYPRNARTHSKRQIRQIADSIKTFGFTNPVLLDRQGTIIAGNGRVQAATLLGMSHVPTIRFEHLTEEQVRAYVIADNRLAEKAGWDDSILAIELQHLLSIDTDFDITITGFEVPEIDLLLQAGKADSAEIETVNAADLGPAVSEIGDLWHLGRHRVLCGNALLDSTFKTLLGGKKADMVLADPPYGVKIDGHATGNGTTHHREFAMGCGEMTEPEFVAFLTTALSLLARNSKSGSVHFIFMTWHHLHELLSAGKQVYDSLLNIVVWAKDQAGMGSLFRSQHELCPVFRHGKDSHRNNIQLGKFGRYRTNVWSYPAMRTVSKQGEEADLVALHPTVKPTQMLADAILDCSARGDLILDSFLGSGSTLLAAERVGRVCCGLEIDPAYVDLAIRRWQRLTGEAAVHETSGERFNDKAVRAEVACG